MVEHNGQGLPRLRRCLLEMCDLHNGKDTRRDGWREGIVKRRYRYCRRYLLHERHLLDVVDEAANCLSVNKLHNSKWTDFFSFSALSTPSLLQNSSNVASSLVCSLKRQCQGAPSAPCFGRENVLTVPWWNDLPCFHDVTESRIS